MIQHQNPIPQLEHTQIRMYLSRFLVKNKKLTQVSLGRKGYWQGFRELTVCRRAADADPDQAGQSIAKVLQHSLACWNTAGATIVATTPPQ